MTVRNAATNMSITKIRRALRTAKVSTRMPEWKAIRKANRKAKRILQDG